MCYPVLRSYKQNRLFEYMLRRTLIMPVFWAIGVSLISMIILGWLTMSKINFSELESEKGRLLSALSTSANNIASVAEDNAWWDEAVLKVSIEKDTTWIKKTMFGALDSLSPYSALIVTNRDGNPIYQEQLRLSVKEVSDIFTSLAPQLSMLKAKDDNSAVSVSGIVSCGMELCLYGASLVIDPTGMNDPFKGSVDKTRPLYILMSNLKREDWSILGKNYDLEDLKFANSDDSFNNSISLYNPDNSLAGYVGWKSRSPGTAFIKLAAFPIVLSFLFVAFMMYRFINKVDVTTRELEKALQSRSDFLATISHEIRTPITGFLGMIDLLKTTQLTTEQQKYVEASEYSAMTLSVLLKDILDYTKSESTELEIEEVVFDLHSLVEQAGFTWQGRMKEQEISLEINIEKNTPHFVKSDPARLTQILFNFLSNACKFSAGGNVILRSKVIQFLGKNVELCLEVEDSGIGVSDENKEKIFHEFKQAESYTTRTFGGTGLGLSICKKIIETLNGTIGVRDGLEKGSIFFINLTIPIGDDEISEAVEIDSLVSKSAHSRQTPNFDIASTDSDNQISHSAKILVAEDNPINQMLISKILSHANYQFEIVNNGLLATQVMEKNKFDLILMDIQMPVMDGLMATKIIKENNPELPIIAITANTDEDDIISYQKMNFYSVVPKPFKKEDLESVILRALSN